MINVYYNVELMIILTKVQVIKYKVFFIDLSKTRLDMNQEKFIVLNKFATSVPIMTPTNPNGIVRIIDIMIFKPASIKAAICVSLYLPVACTTVIYGILIHLVSSARIVINAKMGRTYSTSVTPFVYKETNGKIKLKAQDNDTEQKNPIKNS